MELSLRAQARVRPCLAGVEAFLQPNVNPTPLLQAQRRGQSLSIMVSSWIPGRKLDVAMMDGSSRSVQGQAIRREPSRTQRLKRRLSMEWRFEIWDGGGVVRRRSRYVPPSVSSVEVANIRISGTRLVQTTRLACCEAFFLSNSNSGLAGHEPCSRKPNVVCHHSFSRTRTLEVVSSPSRTHKHKDLSPVLLPHRSIPTKKTTFFDLYKAVNGTVSCRFLAPDESIDIPIATFQSGAWSTFLTKSGKWKETVFYLWYLLSLCWCNPEPICCCSMYF